VLIDRVADFGIHDVFDEESEECVPVDENDTGFGGPNLVADAEGVDVNNGPGGGEGAPPAGQHREPQRPPVPLTACLVRGADAGS